MLVIQQIKVLPLGSNVIIKDCGKTLMTFKKSDYDDSLIFEDIHQSELFNKVYSVFRVAMLDISINAIEQKIYFIIEVRG